MRLFLLLLLFVITLSGSTIAQDGVAPGDVITSPEVSTESSTIPAASAVTVFQQFQSSPPTCRDGSCLRRVVSAIVPGPARQPQHFVTSQLRQPSTVTTHAPTAVVSSTCTPCVKSTTCCQSQRRGGLLRRLLRRR